MGSDAQATSSTCWIRTPGRDAVEFQYSSSYEAMPDLEFRLEDDFSDGDNIVQFGVFTATLTGPTLPQPAVDLTVGYLGDMTVPARAVPARDAAESMYADDAASKSLGMEIIDVTYGGAVLTMTVGDDMVNGLDICHGGLIFSLADSAMAFASNSYNTYAVATNAEIDWVRPAKRGDVLTATATERYKEGRNAITDVVVSNNAGETIAHFRGRTRLVEGQHIPD